MLKEMACEITVVIPTYNCWQWLGLCLHHLEWGAQSLPLKIILCDNGSEDGTQQLVEALGGEANAWWQKKFRSLHVLQPVPQKHWVEAGEARTNKNLEHVWRKLVEAVDTPYTQFVDADVCMPSGGVRTLLEALQEDDELGAAGIIYENKVDHLKQGTMMVRTEIAKAFSWQSEGCPCRWVSGEIERRGYKIRHISPLSARHLKREV